MENWTWQMRREGRTVTGRGNSILSSDRNEFTKARVREARLHTDHQMVLAVLRGEGSWQKHRYVVGMTKCLLAAPTVWPQMDGEAEFTSLKREVERKEQPKLVRAPWISKETRRLADWRELLLQTGRASMREFCKAWRDFSARSRRIDAGECRWGGNHRGLDGSRQYQRGVGSP